VKGEIGLLIMTKKHFFFASNFHEPQYVLKFDESLEANQRQAQGH
jgi:hypothetical protein